MSHAEYDGEIISRNCIPVVESTLVLMTVSLIIECGKVLGHIPSIVHIILEQVRVFQRQNIESLQSNRHLRRFI